MDVVQGGTFNTQGIINKTFYVSINETNECKIPSSYEWSVSEELQIVERSHNQIQVKALKDGLGYVYANFSNGQKVPIKIWTGKPKVYYKISDRTPHSAQYSLSSSLPNTSVEDQNITNIDCSDTEILGNGYISRYCKQGIIRGTHTDNRWTIRRNAIVTNKCGSTNIILDFALYAALPRCDEYNFASIDDNTYKLYKKPCIPIDVYSRSKEHETIADYTNIQIIDFKGNIVINTPNKEFSLSHLLPGTYYARVIKNGKIVHTQTLLKK